MFVQNFAVLCCGLFLLIISSSQSQQHYTNNEDKDHHLTVRDEIYADSTTIYSDEIKPLQYDLYERFIDNTQHNKMEYEFSTISTNIDRENIDSMLYKLRRRSAQFHENDDKILTHSYINSTNVNHEKNSTSQKVYEYLLERNYSMSNKVFENSTKNSNESNIVPYETCHNITCIQFCCPLGSIMRWNDSKCISKEMKYIFPNVYEYTNDLTQIENKRVNEFFHLAIYDPCLKTQRYRVRDRPYNYKILANGSIYLSSYKILFKSKSYCLTVFLERGNRFEVTFCSETHNEIFRNKLKHTPEYSWITHTIKIYSSLTLVCILFLVVVFLVYSILPELRNEHGFMLRNYNAVAAIGLTMELVRVLNVKEDMSYPICITIAFMEYFCNLSGLFWLSTMSFNMWQTFRRFSSLQRNVRQPGKKKLIYYAIFAYGCPFVLAIVCVIIVDYVSEYLPYILRPEFKIGFCWYPANNLEAFILYYYWIATVCIIGSICLSISAARNIKRYEKDTNFSLTNSESKQYNDNKKWLNLYIKLFTVLFIITGINWFLYTILRFFAVQLYNFSYYIDIVSALLNVVENFFVFIIFVWRKKIKLMLLKRFGFKTNASTNTSNITFEVPMQKMSNSCGEENCHTKDSSNGIEFKCCQCVKKRVLSQIKNQQL